MGFKKRDDRPLWQRPRAAADAKKILAVIDADKFNNTTYAMMTSATGLSQRRVELAVLHIQRTCDGLEYVNTGPPFSFRRKRPCSSEAEHLLGKEGVGGSIPPLGSMTKAPPCATVHCWPDGLPKWHTRSHPPLQRVQLWCGSIVGMRYSNWLRAREPISYFWTKNITKVTCIRCFKRYQRKKHQPKEGVVGVVEIV